MFKSEEKLTLPVVDTSFVVMLSNLVAVVLLLLRSHMIFKIDVLFPYLCYHKQSVYGRSTTSEFLLFAS